MNDVTEVFVSRSSRLPLDLDRFPQILWVAEGEKEDLDGWRGFLWHLKDRDLCDIRLIISDAYRGLV